MKNERDFNFSGLKKYGIVVVNKTNLWFGQIENDLPHGKGKLIFENGTFEYGFCQNNKKDGLWR